MGPGRGAVLRLLRGRWVRTAGNERTMDVSTGWRTRVESDRMWDGIGGGVRAIASGSTLAPVGVVNGHNSSCKKATRVTNHGAES